MKRLYVLSFCLLFLVPASMVAQISDLPKIAGLDVEGNRITDEGLILSTAGLRVGQEASTELIRDAILHLYSLRLFYDVRVEGEEVAEGIILKIVVDEYPTLGEVEIIGNDKIKEDQIRETIDLLEGQVISPLDVKEARDQIESMYREKGYLLVRARSELVKADDSVRLRLTVEEGKKVKIKRIEVVGNRVYDDDKIRDQMKTKEDRWWRSGDFKIDEFQADKDRIVDFYRKEGYIDAKVVSDSIWYDESRENMFILVEISEGIRYIFGQVSWDGNEVFDSSSLADQLHFSSGEIFDQEKYEQSLSDLYALYQEDGYLYVRIEDRTRIEGRKVNIDFGIEEGEPVAIDRIVIRGNTKTKEKVIRRELTLKPGEIFRRSALMRSQRELYYLNYFEQIMPDLETSDGGDVSLVFEVKEKPTGQASAGIGYSQQDKLVGNVGFSVPNFRGNGQRLDFSWDFGKTRQDYRIGFTEPWFRDTPTSVGFDVYQSERIWSGYYTELRRGGSVRVGRRLRWPDDYFRIYLKYKLESVRFSEFSRTYLSAVSPIYDLSLREWPQVTSSSTVTLVRDSRDLSEFATRGTVHSLSSELAGGVLLGDVDFHKHIFESVWYVPTLWKLTLSIRGKIGVIDGYRSPSSVPFSERFFPGGISYDGLIRGYEDREVGPKEEGVSIGGRSVLTFNLEYRVPLVEQQVYSLLFADAGDAWLSGRDITLHGLRRSVGLGIRLVAPMIGIIGFDFAYGFDREDGGGWQPHFQIGTQF